MKTVSLTTAVVLGLMANAAMADSYTYKYVGPTFLAGTDHVEVAFTTATPLAANTTYLTPGSAGVISGALTVVGPAGIVNGMNLPLSTFNLRTGATASATVPGIIAWDILGDISNLTATTPFTGVHYQAYTMNTLNYIVGTVTGNYDYDQGTITTFYTSCTGLTGCSLAGNGQPYVGNYSGIINPSLTSAANWTLTSIITTPTPPVVTVPPLTLSGSLPTATVGVAYSATFTATGGTPPYVWAVTGTPSSLSINATTGTISGTPTAAASYAVTVGVQDSANPPKVSTLPVTLNVNAAPTPTPTPTAPSCIKPAGTKQAEAKSSITQVGSGYIVVGGVTVLTPSCVKVEWNGPAGFKVGQKAEYQGYTSANTGTVATQITIN